ncbi:MAG: TerC family protein [Armatimonadota bacterium]
MHVEPVDFLNILILIALEGILSGDNALVLAVLVLPLGFAEQRKALRYGIIGAFVLRAIATLLAVQLTQMKWVNLLGGLYLLYLPYKHFTAHPDEAPDTAAEIKAAATGFLGLSLFWSTVIRVELTDLVFAIDSILVAVAISKKTWVIVTGGLLGILMMRMLTLQVLALVKKYPKLIDGAYIVVAWVGVKLLWEYIHVTTHLLPELPKQIGIGVVIVLFVAAFLYARQFPAPPEEIAATSSAEALFGVEAPAVVETVPPNGSAPGAASPPAEEHEPPVRTG